MEELLELWGDDKHVHTVEEIGADAESQQRTDLPTQVPDAVVMLAGAFTELLVVNLSERTHSDRIALRKLSHDGTRDDERG